ncbi:hypothetical protein [Erythrobacter sp.]|uniref:hypothetical protein n=1 Tax=Erythrobacter sp. TaxID=1042 RepID=UPI001425C355|nr:hypothetical protein [Erythrobacter sp.]QIQ85395.1 MAG: hypothetical protein G9473_00890 [Erythrobacter sp.]
MNGAALAFAALVPLATGPAPQEAETLSVALCGGGTITIPLGDGERPQRECDPKGCHAATCREKDRQKGQRADN